MNPRYIISAYYYSSECVYAFGPFNSDAELNAFLAKDTDTSKHDQWQVIAFNHPTRYGTGTEHSADIWTWN